MRAISGLLALFAALLLAGCDSQIGETFNYRLIVEVETPDGVVTGSSVIQVKVTESNSPFIAPEGRGVNGKMRGEAVAVDLPDGQVLFALLRSESSVDAGNWYAFKGIEGRAPGGQPGSPERARALMRTSRAGDLWPRDYPMLVTFADLDDPTSVERVDPKDLAATFGEGASLKRIGVEFTGEPVTIGIVQRLGWLPDYYGKMLDGNPLRHIDAENQLANSLSQNSFAVGTIQ
ncbi:hypothetical protein [uncultured Erythrobacter sp.]|uniref:hypothetical protein n=1 Tax=uncultured Erythrobacter sp. TaxID=263913 RepID=UPI002628CAEE|nr:hypothetical protein [uncultured Erythrobacter sp.]